MSVKGIANAFLYRSFNENNFVTHMKLQKLIYLAYGYYLAATNGQQTLISNEHEKFRAWLYGPVSSVLYEEFKEFGGDLIDREAKKNILVGHDQIRSIAVPPIDNTSEVKDVIDYVWDNYKSWGAMALSSLTHKKGWAWDRITQEERCETSPMIPDSYIEEDFRSLVTKN